MSFRHIVAGPSRVPFPTSSRTPSHFVPTFPPARSTSPHLQKRYLLQIPHPLLDPKNGTTQVVVRTTNRLPSTLHAFAIMASLQNRFGKVTAIEVTKNDDDYTPGRVVLLTFLRPIKLEKPLLMEIPNPKASPASNHLGGPSLYDIQAILNGSAELPGYEGKSDGGTISFEVSPVARADFKSTGRRRRPRRPTAREAQEDSAIVEALEAFGDGFYGGFAGLAQRYQHLKIRSPGASPEEAAFGLTREGHRAEGGATSGAPNGAMSGAISASEAGLSPDYQSSGAGQTSRDDETELPYIERPKSLFASLPKTHSEPSFPGSSPPPLPSSSPSSDPTPTSSSPSSSPASSATPSSSPSPGEAPSTELDAKKEEIIARALARLQSENEHKALAAQRQERRNAEEAKERDRQAEIEKQRREEVRRKAEEDGKRSGKRATMKAKNAPARIRGQGEDLVARRKVEREGLYKTALEAEKKSSFLGRIFRRS